MTGTDKKETTSHTDRVFLRISVIQTVLAVTGFFVACVALYATLNEADAVRKQQQSAVWPYINLSTVNYDVEQDRAVFRVRLVNSGVGPAKIRSVRVFVDGAPQTSWNKVVSILSNVDHVAVFSDYANGRIVQAGEAVDMMAVYDKDLAHKLDAESNRLSLEICFCSIFDECWVRRLRERSAESVKSCPVSKENEFEN